MDLPVRKTMCSTCPFRDDSPYEYLRADLEDCALNDASRICHSTGTNAIGGRTGKPSLLCRGARDVQLKMMFALKVIDTPTDEAWNAKRVEIGMEPIAVKDPE